jgi:hypothetical protein
LLWVDSIANTIQSILPRPPIAKAPRAATYYP